ncbi:UspA domain protein (plasmid) [Haloterrigena turkmenica DSM 5511]|uniref:UspA domain protein n=1 Tax=Haloterrigena turkmenica (strain ATCC 51198 / DSM 5511 / JCM 9101 / NCIMB 13204 / VKM B-1734 / 4k) TaxID=543526 RepID=D2S116_HALTV|nr:universal stress protein [Haloterrigena turkmenica]ADB63063.1 UspA domain protein [Haloterrigena turkmenica DSM 5511]
MFDRILVPTDGSGPANAALELASRIASPTATIHVLFVSNDDHDANSSDVLDRTAEEILADARETAIADVETVVTEAQRGDPRDRILEYTASSGIELVVMGAHGRRKAEPVVLGRVTEGVVRNASIPVLVVRASDDIQSRYPFDRILVPTDGSEHARVAVERGVEIAAETEAALHLLSVVNVTRYGTESETDALVDRLEENAKRDLEAAAERAAADGVDVRTAVTVGTVYREISAYAETEDIDLLIMGTHGRSNPERELLGSVTERVLRIAPAPVLTVRAREMA